MDMKNINCYFLNIYLMTIYVKNTSSLWHVAIKLPCHRGRVFTRHFRSWSCSWIWGVLYTLVWNARVSGLYYRFKIKFILKYEGGQNSFKHSLREIWDKKPLDRESNKSWCHRHTTSMIKLFLVAAHDSMGIGAAYRQGENFSASPATDVKLGTSGHWVRIQTGAGVTATLI